MMKRFLKRNIVFLLVCAVAAATMWYSNMRATLAAKTAPTIKSAVYEGTVSQQQIGVSLLENGVVVASRDNTETTTDNAWVYSGSQRLLENMLEKDENGKEKEKLVLGKEYPEELSVKNSGTIDEYVRLVVHKYWERVDPENTSKVEKRPDLDPDYITLSLYEENFDATHWKLDPSWPNASYPETIVLYYNSILEAGDTTPPATKMLTVNGLTAKSVYTETKGNITRTVYDYDGVRMVLEAEVDAVQTHNAHDALMSAWGVDPFNMPQSPEQEHHIVVPETPEEPNEEEQDQGQEEQEHIFSPVNP